MPAGFNPKRHMSVDEVKPGMVGFGRTVFRGVKIESFEVEVVSVERGFRAGKAVVWVRCPGDRMQKLGPVSGMSGSPIYLYPRGVDPDRARPSAARMVGAFAFGFGLGKDCFVGVQPIEQMLAAAERADFDRDDEGESYAGGGGEGEARPEVGGEGESGSGGTGRAVAAMLRAADALEVSDRERWRLDALAKLTGVNPLESSGAKKLSVGGRSYRNQLRTPLRVGNEQIAAMLEPMLSGTRLHALSGGVGERAGMPPDWINPHAVELEPGSVLSVPLVAGDLDWASVGTVTDVLEDGTVLAFGHAMDGTGRTNMPMATGYVHFIQPNLQSSFKLGGSLNVVGAVGNDEMSGIVGSSKLRHRYRAATVSVNWPQQSKSRTFGYQLAEDRFFTPLLAGLTVANSLATDTAPPAESTIELNTTATFEDGRELELRALMPQGGMFGISSTIASPIAMLRSSPFGELKLESVQSEVRVVKEVQSAEITNATVRQTTLAPGDEVTVYVQLKPYQGKAFTESLKIRVPEDLADGRYGVQVAGAESYLSSRMEQRPHLMRISDMDELFEMIRYITSLREDALYVSLINMQRPQVAVGRTELNDLPSSKLAMLLQPTSSRATPYVHAVDEIQPIDYVVRGSFSFPIEVKTKPETDTDTEAGQ